MSPLEKAQQEAIIRRISFLEIELEDLEKCRHMDYQIYKNNRTQRRNIERLAENITNAVLDIGKIVLAGKTLEIPGTYAEIFDSIHEAGFISEEHADILRYHVRTMNILAHQYLDLKWDRLKNFMAVMPEAVRDFIEHVSCLLFPHDSL